MRPLIRVLPVLPVLVPIVTSLLRNPAVRARLGLKPKGEPPQGRPS